MGRKITTSNFLNKEKNQIIIFISLKFFLINYIFIRTMLVSKLQPIDARKV